MMFNETGDTEAFKEASVRLKQQRKDYRDYSQSVGLKVHNDRTQVYGFDRSVSSKATWAERKSSGKTLTGSGNGGIIKASGTDRHTYETLVKSKPELIATIDPADSKAITKMLSDFMDTYGGSNVEHCRVITTTGEVLEVRGIKGFVNVGALGDKMNGSINIHNHVKGESLYPFSKEDFNSAFDEKSIITYAFDEKYYYRMSSYYNVDPNLAYNAYKEAEAAICDRRIINKEFISDEDFQHEIIKEACKRLNVKNWRKSM